MYHFNTKYIKYQGSLNFLGDIVLLSRLSRRRAYRGDGGIAPKLAALRDGGRVAPKWAALGGGRVPPKWAELRGESRVAPKWAASEIDLRLSNKKAERKTLGFLNIIVSYCCCY